MSSDIGRPAGYLGQTRRIATIKVGALAMVALSFVSHAPWDRHSFVGDAIKATDLCLLPVVPAAELVAYAGRAGLLPYLIALF